MAPTIRAVLKPTPAARTRWILQGGALLVLLILGMSLYPTAPKNLGLHNGQLAPCGDKPNCVHSQAEDPVHAIAPLPSPLPLAQARERLKTLLLARPRTRLVEERENYLRLECRSALFRFVDDLECHFTGDQIEIRSAARAGHSDLGVNRKRVESIRAEWETHLSRK